MKLLTENLSDRPTDSTTGTTGGKTSTTNGKTNTVSG